MSNDMKKRPRRWSRLLLGLSLALNLAVAGMVIGAIVMRDGRDHRGPGFHEMGMFGLVAMLPPEERRVLRDELRQAYQESGQIGSERAQRREILAALRAPDFDADAFARKLAASRTDRDALALEAEQAISQQLAGLSASDRADYADKLERFRGPKSPRRDFDKKKR